MITNTAKRVPRFGVDIEAQEAQGQRELVASQYLPDQGDWVALIQMGVKRGEPVEDDALFVHAELPEGWTKRATDHAMWTDLLDEKGEKRASIFYKAAFYDRRANIKVG